MKKRGSRTFSFFPNTFVSIPLMPVFFFSAVGSPWGPEKATVFVWVALMIKKHTKVILCDYVIYLTITI